LKISGGTNGAVFVATNSLGQGEWRVLSRFRAWSTVNQYSPATTVTNLYFGDIKYNVGNKFSGDKWIPGRIGYVSLHANNTYTMTSVGNRYLFYIARDGNKIGKDERTPYANNNILTPSVVCRDYCPSVTSVYTVYAYTFVAATNAAAAGEPYVVFEGEELP
jgi:hypothetical protein